MTMSLEDRIEAVARKLTPSEAAVLHALLARPVASREVLARCIPYAGLHSLTQRNKRGARSVDVHICHIRKKLAGLPIETVRGEGWSIPKAVRETWSRYA